MTDETAAADPIEEGLARSLQSRRWFGSKGKELTRIQLMDVARLGATRFFLVLVRTTYSDGSGETYFVPLAGPQGWTSDSDSREALEEALAATPEDEQFADALALDEFCVELYRRLATGEEVESAAGVFRFVPVAVGRPSAQPQVRQMGTEQSNTSVVLDDALVLKAIRKLHHGINPDLEIPRFLTTNTDFRNAPLLAAYAEYSGEQGFTATVMVLQTYIRGTQDAWARSLEDLTNFYRRAGESQTGPSAEAAALYAADSVSGVARLGQRTAELHVALARSSEDPDFAPEPISQWDVDVWMTRITSRLESLLANFQRLGTSLPEGVQEQVQWLLAHQERLLVVPGSLHTLLREQLVKTRYHGDFHLGQVLKTDSDWIIIDFEGPPAAPLEERRAKGCPLADVAGIVRSLDYAAEVALREHADRRAPDLRLWGDAWVDAMAHAFKQAYFEAAGPAPFLPRSRREADEVIDAFAIEKAIYEADYELHHRPDWLDIPLGHLMRLAGSEA
jgi:maltose alpha-D-glucosyltransferase/alpha-amylase